MTPGPHYYRMSDGRQLYEFEFGTLTPLLEGLGLSHRDSHCLLSAAEHEFRRGAKEGEEETDAISRDWWIAHASGLGRIAWDIVSQLIRCEREKMGR